MRCEEASEDDNETAEETEGFEDDFASDDAVGAEFVGCDEEVS